MPNPLKSARLSLLRRIPMPLLAIMIGLACGFVVWVVLDQVQPPALREIFFRELKTRLDQQARETLIRFENSVSAHTSTTRLLANHRQLANYLEPIYWFEADKEPPLLYTRTPPWLPPSSLWKRLVRPSHILLIDTRGRTREIYQVGTQPLPKELTGVTDLYLSESRVQAFLTTFEDRPYLLVSEAAEDATGTVMGSLMLVVPVDQEFLAATQQGASVANVAVGVLDGDEQRFLASSDYTHIPAGTRLEAVRKRYLVTAQSFFQYEGSTLNLQFVTLIPRASVDEIEQRVSGVERRQRLVAAATFISVFTLLFYLLSERLNRILQRISRFSQKALGSTQPVLERGNQLFVLEDWIRQFIQLVLDARDEMRRQHETEMEESAAFNRALMESSLDSIVTLDASGVIIEFNHTAVDTFGYPRESAVGNNFGQLLLAKVSRPAFLRYLGKALAEDAGDAELRSEMLARRADGGEFSVELSIKRLQLHERTLLTVYLHDITQRKQAERAIRSMAKFPSESPSPILRVNRPGVILYANAASEPLLRYWNCGRGQTLPMYWQRRVASLFESDSSWETEVVCEDHIYSLLLAPVSDLGYVNIYGRDISAVRSAERQAREHQQELVHVCRLSTMGEMATGLAHELNQPLAAITNYANGSIRRLRHNPDEQEPILHALDQVSLQARRAGEIIKRLRSLVGKQAPVREVTDLNTLLQEVCSFVEFEASKAHVEIEQDLSIDPLTVRVDAVQIEQVALNLLRNALEALHEVPRKRRSLVISSRRRDDGWLQMQVIDTGPGITAETLSRLFEPFFTTKKSGMGMGLVISKTIIEDHGGRIEASVREQGGTCFQILLPAHQSNNGTENEKR